MNSLEILDDIEKHLKDYLDDLKMTKQDFKLRKFSGVEHIFERLEEKISEVQTSMNNAQKIKQELEILELIKKILFNKYEISTFDGYESGMENPIYYIELEDYDKEHPVFLLEEDEMNKLKQWLDDNKD